MLRHDNIDYFLHAFPVRLGITEIRSAPLRCSERQGYINRYLQVFIIEYGFKHAEKDDHTDRINDNHRHQHNLHNYKRLVKRSR